MNPFNVENLKNSWAYQTEFVFFKWTVDKASRRKFEELAIQNFYVVIARSFTGGKKVCACSGLRNRNNEHSKGRHARRILKNYSFLN